MDTKLLEELQYNKANRFLQEADDMLLQHRWDLAANRYYYACYHMVQALFVTRHIITKTHSGALTEFGKNFVLTGFVDRKFSRFLAHMVQLRIKADYNSVAEVSEDEVREMAPLAHEFVNNLLPLSFLKGYFYKLVFIISWVLLCASTLYVS